MMQDILLYEELSINAHPAIWTHFFDGWILRFAQGYTKRANSINPLYPSSLNAAEKTAFCEEVYSKQGLATVFKLTPLSDGLDAMLQQRGYEKVTPTNLMTKHLDHMDAPAGRTIISHTITTEWQNRYFELTHLIDEKKRKAAQMIQNSIQNTILCGSITHSGKVLACGLGVMERGYVGLFDIIVDIDHRGIGAGFSLCRDILNEAKKIGAQAAYLQVVADNAPAMHLYKKLGFANRYQHWYRVKNTPGAK